MSNLMMAAMMTSTENAILLGTDVARFCEQVGQMSSELGSDGTETGNYYVLDSNLVTFAMRRNAEAAQATFFDNERGTLRQLRANRIAYAVSEGPSGPERHRVFMFERHIEELERLVIGLLNPVELHDKEIDEFLNASAAIAELGDLPEAVTEIRRKFRFVAHLANDDVAALQIFKSVSKQVERLPMTRSPGPDGMMVVSAIRIALQAFVKRSPHTAHTDALALYQLARLNSDESYRRAHWIDRGQMPQLVFYTMDRGLIWLAGMLRSLSGNPIFAGLRVRDARLLPMSPGFVPDQFKSKSRDICFSAQRDIVHAFNGDLDRAISELTASEPPGVRDPAAGVFMARVCHLGYGLQFFAGHDGAEEKFDEYSVREVIEAMGIDWKRWTESVTIESDSILATRQGDDDQKFHGLRTAAGDFIDASSKLMEALDQRLPLPGLSEAELLDKLLTLATREDVKEELDRAFDKVIEQAQGIRFAFDSFFTRSQRESLLQIAEKRRLNRSLPHRLSFAVLGDTPGGNKLFSGLSTLDDPASSPKYGKMLDLRDLSQSERYLVLAFVMAKIGNTKSAFGYCRDAFERSQGARIGIEARLFEVSLLRRSASSAAEIVRACQRLAELEAHNVSKTAFELDRLRLNGEEMALALRGHILSRYINIARNRSYIVMTQMIDGIYEIEGNLRLTLETVDRSIQVPRSHEEMIWLRCVNQVRLQFISVSLFISLDDRPVARPFETNLMLSAVVAECEEIYSKVPGIKSRYSEILLLLGKCATNWKTPERETWLKAVRSHLDVYQLEVEVLGDCEFKRFRILLEKLEAMDGMSAGA